MKLLDSIPLALILVFGIFLTLAPIYPQPHLLEKIQMLFKGELSRPVDIFDLCWHSLGLVLIALKLLRIRQLKNQST